MKVSGTRWHGSREASFAVLALGFAVTAVHGVGCAASTTEDDGDDPSTSTTTTTTTTSGGGGAGGDGTGGSGAGPGLCAMDCGTITTQDCFKAVCNEGTYPGPVGQCVVVPEDAGVACDDGEFCTTNDACDGSGQCVGGPQNTCGMTAPECQEITCDEQSDTCGTLELANGTTCTPTDLCLTGATCVSGSCTGGTPKDCFFSPVPNECFNAVCNPNNGMCEPVAGNDGLPCIDSMDLCSLGNTCSAGMCQGGTQKDCSSLTQGCDLGVCDPMTGNCGTQTVMPGQQCDDLDGCTLGETCDMNGMCSNGTPITNCSLTGDGCCPSNCTPVNDLDCQTQPNCLAIKTSNAAATDGVYSIDPDASGPIQPFDVYCDMTTGITYEALGIGQHNTTVAGWTWISATELQKNAVQQAFIYLYNTQGGLTNITPNWSSGNCCVREAGNNQILFLGGQQTRPANAANNNLVCLSSYPDSMYRFGRQTVGAAIPPLPTNYFTTNPPTAQTACGDNNNPGFFFKQY